MKVHALLMGIAFSVGLSRVYLMQHFLVDIWAGALLGIGSTMAAYFIVLKTFSKKEFQKGILHELKRKPSF
jgi:membrane-associated phospholipid phosphatase